jgi:hypothetical protein
VPTILQSKGTLVPSSARGAAKGLPLRIFWTRISASPMSAASRMTAAVRILRTASLRRSSPLWRPGATRPRSTTGTRCGGFSSQPIRSFPIQVCLSSFEFHKKTFLTLAVFVPVMEVFDFISESKKFLTTLKDLLDLQYRYVLEGATYAMDIDLKIRQGLERSMSSIYNWIETVVQDWEQRISGTFSMFTSSAIRQATSDASSPQLPPSPAPTPSVVAGSMGATTVSTGSESPGATTTPAVARPPANRRRTNPPPKRIKRPDILPKAPPPTQIPVPIQRARTPQGQPRVTGGVLRPSPPVLPSQSVHNMQPATTQSLNPSPQYPTTSGWDHTAVAVSGAYNVPYTSPTDVFQHPAMTPTHYAPIHPNALDVQQSYLGSEQQTASLSPEGMPSEMDARPQSASLHANRFTISSTPRSSLASMTWIRDENRDSSQTLVEAHPPGKCANLYCPSCSKPYADELVAQPSPVAINPVTGAPQQHHGFHTAGPGQRGPFQASPLSADVHGMSDQVDWSFHSAGGIHGAGGDGMFGGHHGPREEF